MTDSGGSEAGLQSAGRHGVATGWGLWAVYVGVSWTWCIGMFLPALLWRDFGIWSFAVFALPNIVGAAALGLVMKSPESSRLFMERHHWACSAFSAVTIAFQVFFAAWIARIMGGGAWHAGWVLCVVSTLLSGGGARLRRAAAVAGVAVWAVSVATIALTVVREEEGGLLPELTRWPGALPAHELVPLAMVCLVGFGLCPYLDRTFHRARIETGTRSVRTFGLGFGFFFALMIVGTLLTTPVLLWIVGASGSVGGPPVGRLLIALFAAHTLPQLVYTCWVHGGEAKGQRERGGLALTGLITGLAVTLLSGDVLVRSFGWDSGWAGALFGGEVIYRCFMAFYGLIFPAYIAIVAWPVGCGGRPMRKINLLILTVVLLAAAWFYWTGFVERRTWWIAGGVAIVVVGAVLACVLNRSAAATHASRLPSHA